MKKKLKLSELSVKSFVTQQDIKGGVQVDTATRLDLLCMGHKPTDPVIGCDPRDSVPSNCGCTGMYRSLNMACPTLDTPC